MAGAVARPTVTSEMGNLVGSATAPTTKGEAKEIDNRGMGEYHEPYFFSRLRSVKAHEEPGLLAGC